MTGTAVTSYVSDLGDDLLIIAMGFTEDGPDLTGRARVGLTIGDGSTTTADGASLYAGWFHIVAARGDGGYPGLPEFA